MRDCLEHMTDIQDILDTLEKLEEEVHQYNAFFEKEHDDEAKYDRLNQYGAQVNNTNFDIKSMVAELDNSEVNKCFELEVKKADNGIGKARHCKD